MLKESRRDLQNFKISLNGWKIPEKFRYERVYTLTLVAIACSVLFIWAHQALPINEIHIRCEVLFYKMRVKSGDKLFEEDFEGSKVCNHLQNNKTKKLSYWWGSKWVSVSCHPSRLRASFHGNQGMKEQAQWETERESVCWRTP